MTEGPSDEGGSHLGTAFSAYVDTPSAATEAVLLATAPGEFGVWLRDVGDACQEWPDSAWRLSAPSDAQWARATWLRTGEPGPPRFGEPLDEGAQVALAAFAADPGNEARDAVCRAVPIGAWQWYADFCEAYRELPGSAWGPALRPVELEPAPVTDAPQVRRRQWALPRPRLVVPSLAAAVAAVVACLVLVFGGSTMPPAQVKGTPVVWRLAGFINDVTWRIGGAPGTSTADVVCPVASTCYANQPSAAGGSGVVMRSDDGGATWRPRPLPDGWRTTSPLACAGVERCLVGAHFETGSTPGEVRDAAVLATIDGGANWSVGPLIPGVADVVQIACSSSDECVGVGYGPPAPTGGTTTALAVVTADGGVSWAVVGFPGPFVASDAGLSCTAPRSCVVVGASSFAALASGGAEATAAALYSVDGGRTWHPAAMPSTLARLQAVACGAANHCVAVGNPPSAVASPGGRFGATESLVSVNGGQSWAIRGAITGSSVTVTGLSCPSAQDCWAVGVLPGKAQGAVEATRDGGATWSSVALSSSPDKGQTASGPTVLQIQGVSSVSCPPSGPCTALGLQGGVGADQQLVLRGGGI